MSHVFFSHGMPE